MRDPSPPRLPILAATHFAASAMSSAPAAGRLRRQAISHGDADKAVPRGPERDVVVERTPGAMLVPSGERAAMDEDEHRLRS